MEVVSMCMCGACSECRSSLLQSVDNWGVLQLDIAWCYAGLRSVAAAADAALRLAAAERALTHTYGPDQRRLMELKGNDGDCRHLLLASALFYLHTHN